MATNNQSHAIHHDPATTEGGTGNGGFVEDSGLNGSFRGLRQLDQEVAGFFYAFGSSDSTGSSDEQGITPESLARDAKRLRFLAGLFERLRGRIYCAGRKEREATEKVIRSVMENLRHDLPIIVAILLHTEFRHEERVFIPADPPNVIMHSDVSRWLLRSRGTAPVAVGHACSMVTVTEDDVLFGSILQLLAESCYSINEMGLPWKGFVGGEGRLVWERIHNDDNREWESIPLMVQLAATMPEEGAASFRSVGSVYTRALCNSWNKPFGSMMTSIQEDMNSTLEGRSHSQHHVVYSSRTIGDNEMLWSILGLERRL